MTVNALTLLSVLYLTEGYTTTHPLSTHQQYQRPSASKLNASSSSSSYYVTSKNKNSGLSKTLLIENDNIVIKSSSSSSSAFLLKLLSHPWQRITSAVRSTFLPSGYPNVIPPSFLQYSIWAVLQDLSTQLRSVVATQRILEGVGVGKEGATALSAALNFIVRDGAGMFISLLFTALASSRFRCDIKRWRLFADLIVDVGITLEVLSSLVPQVFFLPMICVGNMCKAMCGVAAGASGGAINLYWAKGSDISDINAKFGAQNTMTGIFGLVFAALFARSTSSRSNSTVWIIYSFLTILHIFANVKCMKLVAFDSLNTIRMNMIAMPFIKSWILTEQDQTTLKENGNDSLPLSAKQDNRTPVNDPVFVAKREPLFFLLPHKFKPSIPIKVGVSFDDIVKMNQQHISMIIPSIVTNFQKDNYALVVVAGQKRQYKNNSIFIAFSADATPTQKAKAYFHALFIAQMFVIYNNNQLAVTQVEEIVNINLDEVWDRFRATAERCGWDFDKTDLNTLGYEIEWGE